MKFELNLDIILTDKLQKIGNPAELYDAVFKDEIRLYKRAVSFVQKVQIIVDDVITLKRTIHYVVGDGINKLEAHTKILKLFSMIKI